MSWREDSIPVSNDWRSEATEVREETPSRLRSLVGAYPKGLISETGTQIRQALSAFPKLFGLDQQLQGTLKTEPEAQEEIQRIFPTQEDFPEKILERAGRLTPYTATGGGSVLGTATRTGLASLLGQTAEEAGLPPAAQSIAEIFALGVPAFSKKITPTAIQKPLVEGGREIGMTEKEITPLIHGKEKKILPKVSFKKFRTQKALEKSKTALDTAAEKLETHPSMDVVLASPQANTVMNNIDKIISSKFSSDERKLIKGDLEFLKSSPKSLGDFYKFFRDLNKVISKNPEARKTLNLLKPEINNAIKEISPEFAKTFDLTNKLYSNYFNINEKLTPHWQDIFKSLAGRGVGHAILGPLLGYVPSLVVTAGEVGARNLAREMLINPRFQNLSKQIVKSLNENKIGIASQLWKRLTEEIREDSPETAEEMEQIDWNSFGK